MMRTLTKQQTGFTLVEMIMVIVITGIIGGIVAVFLKAPIQQYMDVARRAELTDIADTAVRRMARDVRTAVPNSVRPDPAGLYVEFLPTKDGGRYRANSIGGAGGCAAVAGDSGGDTLNFVAADTCFEIIGKKIALTKDAVDEDKSDQIVIGSTQSDGDPPYNKTFIGNGVRRPYMGATGEVTQVQISAEQFPAFAELQSQRFQVVPGNQQAVTYACIAAGGGACPNTPVVGDGTGTCQLVRYWGYGFIPDPANAVPPAFTGQITVPVSAILADKVSYCEITYEVPNQRFGLLAVRLTLTSGGESVSLYNEIHVNNAP